MCNYTCIIIYKDFRFTSSYSHSIHRKPKKSYQSMLHLATGPNAGQGAASQTYLGATRRISNRLGVLTFLYFPDSNHPKKNTG